MLATLVSFLLADKLDRAWGPNAHERLLSARLAIRTDLVVAAGLHDKSARRRMQLTKLVRCDAYMAWICKKSERITDNTGW